MPHPIYVRNDCTALHYIRNYVAYNNQDKLFQNAINACIKKMWKLGSNKLYFGANNNQV